MKRKITKLISLIIAALMLVSIFLTSCNKMDTEEDTPIVKDTSRVPQKDNDAEERIDSYGILFKNFICSVGGETYSLCFSELYFGKDDEGALFSEGCGTVIYDGGKFDFVAASDSGKMCVSLNTGRVIVIYISDLLTAVSDTYGIDVGEILKNSMSSTDNISDWFAGEMRVALGDINFSVLLGKILEFTEPISSSLLKEEKLDFGGVSVEVNTDVLYEWYVAVGNETVKSLYESIFGVGSFVDFKTAVAAALPLSVSDIISELEKTGADREKIFSALDSLAKILTRDDNATLESLIGVKRDIEDTLSDPNVVNYSFADILYEITGAKNGTELSDVLADFYNNLSTKSLPEYLGIKEKYVFFDKDIKSLCDGVDINYTKTKSGKIDYVKIHGESIELESIFAGIENVDIEISNGKLIKFSLTLGTGEGIFCEVELVPNYKPEGAGENRHALMEKTDKLPTAESIGDAVLLATENDKNGKIELIVSEDGTKTGYIRVYGEYKDDTNPESETVIYTVYTVIVNFDRLCAVLVSGQGEIVSFDAAYAVSVTEAEYNVGLKESGERDLEGALLGEAFRVTEIPLSVSIGRINFNTVTGALLVREIP